LRHHLRGQYSSKEFLSVRIFKLPVIIIVFDMLKYAVACGFFGPHMDKGGGMFVRTDGSKSTATP
jgi:hypothetical protein